MPEHQSSTNLPVLSINNIEIRALFYKDEPVLTFEMVAKVHKISIENVRSSFYRHQKRFREGKHYFRLDFTEANQLLLSATANSNGIILLTQRGYSFLVKPMRDDTSWEVQERMVDEYFTLRERQQVSEADRIINAFLGKPRFEAKRFTVEFYGKVARVYNKRIPTDHRHSKMMGGFLERYIYKPLPTLVRAQMDAINPRINGNRKYPLHQMLTAEMDTAFLRERMRTVGEFLDACRDGDWRTFRYLINNYDRRHCMQVEIEGEERMLLPVFDEAQLVLFEPKQMRQIAGTPFSN
jgi:hypothetical protein